MNKVDASIEGIKALALTAFLWIAFKDAALPDALWVPAAGLFRAAIIVGAFLAGQSFANTYKEGWKNYLVAFYGVGILTLMAWGGYGTHIEDADPIYGGGDTVVDFEPTVVERADHALTIFTTLIVPTLWGMYKKRSGG